MRFSVFLLFAVVLSTLVAGHASNLFEINKYSVQVEGVDSPDCSDLDNLAAAARLYCAIQAKAPQLLAEPMGHYVHTEEELPDSVYVTFHVVTGETGQRIYSTAKQFVFPTLKEQKNPITTGAKYSFTKDGEGYNLIFIDSNKNRADAYVFATDASVPVAVNIVAHLLDETFEMKLNKDCEILYSKEHNALAFKGCRLVVDPTEFENELRKAGVLESKVFQDLKNKAGVDTEALLEGANSLDEIKERVAAALKKKNYAEDAINLFLARIDAEFKKPEVQAAVEGQAMNEWTTRDATKFGIRKTGEDLRPVDKDLVYEVPQTVTAVKGPIKTVFSASISGEFICPVPGPHTFSDSSDFGKRTPFPTSMGMSTVDHEGVDLSGKVGDDVKAAADGIVSFANRLGKYGNLMKIKHPGNIETWYAHLNDFIAKPGQEVKQGAVVAHVGRTGGVTGPHLHFEVHFNGGAVDFSETICKAGIASIDKLKTA